MVPRTFRADCNSFSRVFVTQVAICDHTNRYRHFFRHIQQLLFLIKLIAHTETSNTFSIEVM